MRIRWTNAAAADMQSISDYLKDHHPHYRQPAMRKLYERIRALKDAPYIGRPGREEGGCVKTPSKSLASGTLRRPGLKPGASNVKTSSIKAFEFTGAVLCLQFVLRATSRLWRRHAPSSGSAACRR
jgi:hypothetical protein